MAVGASLPAVSHRHPEFRISEGEGRRVWLAADSRHRCPDRGFQLGRDPRHVRGRADRRHIAHSLRPYLPAPLRASGLKIAIVSDIHSNWQALEAVLRDCPPVDETICLRSEEHTSELQSPCNLVCRLLLEKKK